MSDSSAATQRTSFRAFLSHRYKSPQINEYFFSAFPVASRCHRDQFQVDKDTVATHAWNASYAAATASSASIPTPNRPTNNWALIPSIYRLELDLAARSGKPAIVFIDRRYGSVLAPPSITQVRFLDEEVVP